MKNNQTYSVESVTSGHPDKICDQISDAILDAHLDQDPQSRVAVETFGCHGLLIIGGEITSRAKVDCEKIARKTYKQIGYQEKLKIISNIQKQSPDISMGVDGGGAGDQGIMYGYATNETEEFLPRGVVLVHRLAEGLEKLRKTKQLSWLKPDGKTQVTIKNGKIESILVSTQHSARVKQEEIKRELISKLVFPVIGKNMARKTTILVNPTGKFVLGGFAADTGLTGRKIMVDTYGGLIPHGGGCFSGKDGTKVDRSAAYMCRYAAKKMVAGGLAKECLVSVAYAIGKKDPLMVCAKDEKGRDLSDYVQKSFSFRPLDIINQLGLRWPIFQPTACYGHFGKPNLPWEKV